MTGTLSYIFDCVDLPSQPVSLPDGVQTVAIKQGSVCLSADLVLKNVLYVPNIKCSLISIGKLILDSNCTVKFTNKLCIIQDRNTRTPIRTGELRNGVYYFQPVAQDVQAHATTADTTLLLHQRLGHPSSLIMSFISSSSRNCKIKKILDACDVCYRAKQTRTVFPISDNKNPERFGLIHCDLWGPYTKSSSTGSHYFLTLVDDNSRAVWVYLMKEKTEVPGCFRNFFATVNTQFGKIIKLVRSDNGTEFKPLLPFFPEQGVIFQTTRVGTPQQNGRVERKHHNILEVARALSFQASLPIGFWADCVQAAVHLINRTPTRLLQGKTPYEVLFGSLPNLDLLKVFGCLCYVHNKQRPKDKFGSRSRKCVFFGVPF